jgi:Putative addiction module component
MALREPLLDGCIHSVNHSRMSLTSIQEEIIRLSSIERAMLIDILWESLDEGRIKEIEAKWAAESEEQIDTVDRGELQTIDGPSALRDFRSFPRNDAISVYVRCAC